MEELHILLTQHGQTYAEGYRIDMIDDGIQQYQCDHKYYYCCNARNQSNF